MTREDGASWSLDSRTLGNVIDSLGRRLEAVPPGDPAARLAREYLDDVTEQRDRIAVRENAKRYEANVAAFAAGCVIVLASIGGACLAVYDLVGHAVSSGVQLLGASLGLALIGGFAGILIRWPEIREYRANRTAPRS